jgi:DNA-binding helix-hairpin-helix protein with protein kinase domain
MLSAGEVVLGARMGQIRIVDRIGGGGQGDVYRAAAPDGTPVAVKWYKSAWATSDQRRALDDLITRGTPDSRFLWPMDRVELPAESRSPGGASFGYVMPLCEPGFVPLVRLVNGTLDPALEPGFAEILHMSQALVESFRLIHLNGLCYRDVSLGNVFFRPATGDIRICDVDNVSVDDGSPKVLGTPLFMAPEIVRDTGLTTFPSRRTDLHSLAVLLFLLLFMEHPLIGRKVDMGMWDEQHAVRHFGEEPVFVFDPYDFSNRPVKPHVERYWALYPQFVRDRMLVAFGEGLRTPTARVTEGEWLRTLADLRDCMASCPACGATVFYDLARNRPQPCHSCGRPLPRPLVLTVGRRRLVVSPHLRFGADVNSPVPADGPPIAETVRHPSMPGRLGLKNMTAVPWTVTMPDATRYVLGPRQAIDLVEGMSIETPTVSAKVVRV